MIKAELDVEVSTLEAMFNKLGIDFDKEGLNPEEIVKSLQKAGLRYLIVFKEDESADVYTSEGDCSIDSDEQLVYNMTSSLFNNSEVMTELSNVEESHEFPVIRKLVRPEVVLVIQPNL